MKIEAHEFPVGDILSDKYRFTIPKYQRPYAWTVDEAEELLDDLKLAALDVQSLDDADPYFLGSIVLVKRDDSADAEVIDGQQRLTTLTILLSVLRDYVPDGFAKSLDDRIFQKGDPILQIVDQPRLKLRQQDQWFFEQHVQTSVDDIETLVIDTLPESQQNLVKNARLYREKLTELTLDERMRLVQFIIKRTYIVVVATQDFDSAFRIFAVLNERGLSLTHSDILKSEIVGRIPPADHDTYLTRWEAEESDLGREPFQELFSHIRMVFARTRARESILKEFRSSVLIHYPDGRVFIDKVLVPLSDAYEVVTRSSYNAPEGADAINQLLNALNRLDSDWIPPAIQYVRQPGMTAPVLRKFLADLERLAASMFIRRVDLWRRIDRYGLVLRAMEDGSDLYAPESPLQLTAEERAATRDQLAGEIYTVARTRLYIMLRLDAALSAGGVTHDHSIITVEHVLPQNPPFNSKWRTWFTDEERSFWVHRLANLTLLPRKKNSEAANFEFESKKMKYFSGKLGVVTFALTSQVMHEDEWTPALLEVRQKSLLNTLTALWRL